MTKLALVAMLLGGCSATMVSQPGSGSAFAPVNEASRPGTVKYLNQGASGIVKSRREDAYRQMHKACGGQYRIDGEGPRAEGGVIMPVGNSAMYAESQYWYIQFSCVSAVAAR